MKKILAFVILSAGFATVSAQSVFPTNGENVGIGTTNPTDKLQIEGNQFSIRNSTTNNGIIFNVNAFGHPAILPTNGIGTMDKSLLLAPYGGNVGIGTTSPTAKLEVGSGGDFDQLSLIKNTIEGSKGAGIVFKNIVNDGSITEIGGIQAKLLHGGTGLVASSLSFYTKYNAAKVEALTINPQGDIGIGTTSPREKLSVNGNIRAREIKVEARDWPDYVFATDYRPLTPDELERYISVNKHLPGLPSAKEAEENGVELGKMNKKLLEKIEELTLYMISQQKEINELKKKRDR
ncbi:hypothetical protein ACUN24_13540 [Pedobacter sp. WC2501]|uniref:hypothetical protein n=1 Tax=Pedobacter sp. WC2501 TaxID=3461400 RepID=UPI004046566E